MKFTSKIFPIGTLIVFSLAFWLGTRSFAGQKSIEKDTFTSGSQEKFDFLSKKSSNRCGLLGEEIISSFSDEQRIQGSCCSLMNLHRYQEQVEELKKFSDVREIPQDPYDISAKLVKELLTFQKEITLNPNEQKIYDEAMSLTHEGGPCCCRCWRWTAFDGQAKYLITKHNFTAEQIAQVWDSEDGCGGAGHAQDHT